MVFSARLPQQILSVISMSSDQGRIRSYDAGSYRNPGLLTGLRSFLSGVHRDRWQIWQAFRRDLEGRFRGTALGLFWAVALPLVPVSAYVFLRAVLSGQGNPAAVHPAVYVAIGVTVWFCLTDALLLPTRVINRSRAYLSQNPVRLSSAVLARLGDLLLDLLVRLVFVAAVIVWLHGLPPVAGVLLFSVSLLLGMLAMLGIGVFVFLLQLSYPDTENILVIVLRYLIFVSLAIFPMTFISESFWAYWLNPFAVLIDGSRDILLNGAAGAPGPFAGALGLTLLLGFLGFYVLEVSETRIRSLL